MANGPNHNNTNGTEDSQPTKFIHVYPQKPIFISNIYTWIVNSKFVCLYIYIYSKTITQTGDAFMCCPEHYSSLCLHIYRTYVYLCITLYVNVIKSPKTHVCDSTNQNSATHTFIVCFLSIQLLATWTNQNQMNESKCTPAKSLLQNERQIFV